MMRRLGLSVVVFLAVMSLVALTGLHRPIDYAVFRLQAGASSGELRLSREIRLVDVHYPVSLAERGDPTLYRARLADLLARLAADPANLPRAVVLDVWFSKDDRGLAPLAEAIAHLERLKVPVYASFNPEAEGQTDFDALMREHARSLYEERLAGYGHTRMQSYRGVLSYPRELAFPSAAGTHIVQSLPGVLARDLDWPDALPGGTLVVPIGSEASVDDQTVVYRHVGEQATGGRFQGPDAGEQGAEPDFRGAVLVVGSVAADVRAATPQAGPKLVAWALEDARKGHRGARVPLDHPALVAGLILAAALVTALAMAVLFKFVRPLQTRPAVLACLAMAAGFLALAALAAACAALGYVAPVGLPGVAILAAGVLGGGYAFKFLATGAAEGAGKYDVFISYSRHHGDWVTRHLFEPLAALRDGDGRPLRIFFDRAEIGLGEAFTAKYMWAIVDSRVFVPVFSADYYAKHHCRNEMDLAYKRYVEKRIHLAPLALEAGAVPEIFSVLNYFDVTANPDFLDAIARTVFGSRQGERP